MSSKGYLLDNDYAAGRAPTMDLLVGSALATKSVVIYGGSGRPVRGWSGGGAGCRPGSADGEREPPEELAPPPVPTELTEPTEPAEVAEIELAEWAEPTEFESTELTGGLGLAYRAELEWAPYSALVPLDELAVTLLGRTGLEIDDSAALW